MTTRLIIARHGNTFTAEQTPTRVGSKTDLPLVESERGTNIGKYLKLKKYNPIKVFAAPLKRTAETAKLAIKGFEKDIPLELDNSFIEIDYGPDENKTEEEVQIRLGKTYLKKECEDMSFISDEELSARGKEVIDLWNKEAIVPDGWKVSPEQLINTWLEFGKKIEKEFHGKDILVISSNGIIRFAPYLTGDFIGFTQEHKIKVGTGNICVFEKDDNDTNWRCTEWNTKPKNFLE